MRLVSCLALGTLSGLATAQGEDAVPSPATVPELTEYRRTCSHDELVEFLGELAARSTDVRLETLGHTAEGRELVLVAAGMAAQLDPASAARVGVPIVYVQGNIHGGEVCGKEAMLQLLRDLLLGPGEGAQLLQQIGLLVVPDYNPDGNDRFDEVARHRPGQVGPEQVGIRYNSNGLDLNRDYMKAASEEMRAVLRGVIRAWDPDVLIDLHTTNGSMHGFQLTYAPPLQPTPGSGYVSPEDFVRERLLQPVRRAAAQAGVPCFDYGNFGRGERAAVWSTYDHRPRYGTNYMALRGRMAVLSEAYSYADFRTRVRASYVFVLELLRHIARNGEAIRALHAEHGRRIVSWGEDPRHAPPLGIEFELARRPRDEVVQAGVMERDERGRRRPTGELRPQLVAVYDRFRPTREVPYPAGFFVPESEGVLLAALERHGIRVQRLREPWSGEVEVFVPEEVRIAGRAFQGRNLLRARGERRIETRELAEGVRWVTTAQPLGLLASYLLDPEYEDGLIAWREASFEPAAGEGFPVVRVLAAPEGLRVR